MSAASPEPESQPYALFIGSCLCLFICYHRRKSLKRKELSDSTEESAAEPNNTNATVPTDDYEAGILTCENCGERISWRDEETKELNLKKWDAHRAIWYV
jgi:hypothetical protein